MNRTTILTLATVSFVGIASATASAMHDDHDGPTHPIAPTGEIIPRFLDSGLKANPDGDSNVVFAHVVFTDDAAWQRLLFSEVTLIGESTIRFTSLLDGAVQELDADGIAMWGNTSAYFNGNAVLVELIAAPQTIGNRLVLEELVVQFISAGLSNHCTPPLQCGICVQDDRVQSDENWAPRLMIGSGGCSAAIYNTQSCVVSAGHCMGANMVIQFNVPKSNPNCSINHPPVEDQFPILQQMSQNGGVGADWAVMTSGTNNLGETAYERYGEFRPIAPVVPSSGPVEVWGYGVTDDCILRQTQQHSTGDIVNLTSSAVYYSADVTCGNSGSSLLQNDQIIGIVSHCTWNCPPEGNIATRINVSAFAAAREQLCPDLADPVEVTVPGDYNSIQAAINDVPPKSTITVAPGTYNEALNFNGRNVTVISSGGPEVTTINAAGANSSVVRFSSNETSQAVLEGFTLTGGTGSLINISGTNYLLGGGIYTAGSSPSINNCIIVGNTAQFGGGAFNNNASPTFNNCHFIDNTANPSSGGGVFNFSGATATFNNCSFISNVASANGGGMSNQGSSPTVINSEFIDNEAAGDGGAVRNIQSSAGSFTGSTFAGNSAGGTGGAFINDSSPSTTIGSSEFCDNSPNHIAGSFNNGGGNTFEDDCPETCPIPADLNCDGVVNVADLLILFDNWGDCANCAPGSCPADLNDDCVVNVADLLILFDNWG